jgi:hypothetical protein
MNAEIWDELLKQHPRDLVKSICDRIQLGEAFEITALQFVANTSYQTEKGERLLDALAGRGLLRKTTQLICRSGEVVTEAQASEEVCPVCGKAFADIGRPEVRTLYGQAGTRRRDVRWALVLHGMNTRGPWQEELNWLISRTYGRSVPVAIYKYGVVRPGAILKFRLAALRRQLSGRIHRLSGESETTGFGGVPDILAHSLGTWLLGHALKADPSLKVGRVILTGSILRPDFDWASLIAQGRVEAVLCHYGTKDFWAGVAQYVIPDSGPSGRRGFNDQTGVYHFKSEGIHHSDFFLEQKMSTFYRSVWEEFLTSQAFERFKSDESLGKKWKPTWWILRATVVRWCILLFLLAALLLLATIFGIGVSALYQSWKAVLGAALALKA